MIRMKRGITSVLAFLMMFSVIFSGVPGVQASGATRKVETVNNTPDFSITRTMDKKSYVEGDTATISYTVTPKGFITSTVRTPADITLMLDVSGSMDDYVWVDSVGNRKGYYSTKLEQMRIAAKAFVDSIATENAKEKDASKKDRISVIFFETKVRGKVAFTTNYTSVKTAIDGYDANGGTNYDEALRIAKTDFMNSANRSKVAVFFSDGKPTHFSSKVIYAWTGEYKYYHDWYGGWYREKVYGSVLSDYAPPVRESWNDSVNLLSKMAAMRSLRELRAFGATVYTVGLGDGHGTSGIDYKLLEDMAAAGGGTAYKAENASGLNDIFKRIAYLVNTASFKNISINDVLPENTEILPDQPNVTPSADGTRFIIQVPNIDFTEVNVTPPPMTFEVKIKFPVSGLFELKGGKVNYKDVYEIDKIMDLVTLSVTVMASNPPNAPTFNLEPNRPTNGSVKVTINYPSDATLESRKYKVVPFGEDSTKIDFVDYTEAGIIITDECSVDKPVMIYATCANSFKRQSTEGILAVTNIDKTKPGAPTITTDISTLSVDKVSVTIVYPSDVTVKEYRLNDATTWTAYTGAFDVVPMGTKVEARGTDAAGNVSPIEIKYISMFSSIDFKFEGGKLQTSVMRRGNLVANLIFKTTGTGTPRFVLTSGDDNSKTFLAKLEVKNSTIKDSAGNTYSVTKDPVTNEITVLGTSAISTNGTELNMKLVLSIKSDTPYSTKGEFYKLMLKDTKSILEVRVVRNPKLY